MAQDDQMPMRIIDEETLEGWASSLDYANRKLSKGLQFPGAQSNVLMVRRQIESELSGKELCQSCEGSGTGIHPDEICLECDGSGFAEGQKGLSSEGV